MGTLFDYLKWRGDLSFQQAPLNEVDCLIFSLLTYVDFRGVVSGSHDPKEALTLRTAINAFFAKNPDDKKITIGFMIPKTTITLMRIVKETRRFRNVGVKGHVNDLDPVRQMQFSATSFILGEDSTLVAYRGTDDTLIGWKENFNMSFMESVPAQREAAAYLNTAGAFSSGDLYVTGHSKGGNLAVYAAVYCEDVVRARLAGVWSNDGPGFCNSMLNNPTYIKNRPLFHTIIPESSVVGILLEHEESYTVIKSRKKGPYQHDGMTWEVSGPSFVHLQTVSEGCKRFDKGLNTWIKKMSLEQRAQFADALYQLLSVDKDPVLSDLISIKKLWKAKGRELDPQVYAVLKQTLIGLLGHSAKSVIGGFLPRRTAPATKKT